MAMRDEFLVREVLTEDLEGARRLMVETFEQDFGYGLRPEIHRDVLDLRLAYLETPRQCLFVAVSSPGGAVVGTAAIRRGGTVSPPHPAWLAAKYDPETTCELMRVYVQRDWRRRGVGRALVEAARRWVAAERGYTTVCLHSNVGRTGADTFWYGIATEVFDARPTPFNTVHFELPLDRPIPGAPAGSIDSTVAIQETRTT
jgi:GNAT superfamily N-acetyltransferase